MSQTNEAMIVSRQYEVSKEIDIENVWYFNYLGKSMTEFLSDYIDGPIYNTVKDTIERALYDKRNTLTSFSSSTFVTQTLITTGVAVSALIILFLMISPLVIMLFRRKIIKSPKGKSWSPVHTMELFLFEVFNLSSFTAVIGAIILIISSIRAYRVALPFSYANHSIELVYSYRERINNAHTKHVRGILSNTYESTTDLIVNSETTGKTYASRIQTEFEPVLEFAEEIRLQLVYSAEILEYQKNRMDKMLKDIEEQSRLYANDFIETVNLLKENKELEAVLNPLLKLPAFAVTANVTEALSVPIEILKEAQKPDLSSDIQKVYLSLKMAASKPHYNPSVLIIELQNFAFRIERVVRTLVERYLAFMEKNFLNTNETFWKQKLDEVKSDFFAPSTILYYSILFLASLSIICVFLSGLAYSSLIYAPKYNAGSMNALVKISGFSKSWGSFLFYSIIAISCFLWLLWMLNTLLFIVAFLPLEICEVIKDKSVYNATIDNERFRRSFHFFNTFSSSQFNLTAYETLNKCSMDNTYLAFLPDTLVSVEDRNSILSELNFTEAINSFEKSIGILSFNVSSQNSSLYDMSHILDDVNLKTPFEELKDLSENVTQLNASSILQDIYASSNNSQTSQLVIRAFNAFQNLEEELQRGFPFEKVLNASLEQVNATLHTIHKQFMDFVWISDGLYEKLPEYPSIYNLTLKGTISGMVDTFFSTMRAEIKDYRRSMSFCDPLTILHEESIKVFCQISLYPLVLCWMGSFIISLSLIITVTIGTVTSLREIAGQQTGLTPDQMENGSKEQIDRTIVNTKGEKQSTSNQPKNQSGQINTSTSCVMKSSNSKENIRAKESSPQTEIEMTVNNEESIESSKSIESSHSKIAEMDVLNVERNSAVNSSTQMETELKSNDEGNGITESSLPKIMEKDEQNNRESSSINSLSQTQAEVSSNVGKPIDEGNETLKSPPSNETETNDLNVERNIDVNAPFNMDTAVKSIDWGQIDEINKAKKSSPTNKLTTETATESSTSYLPQMDAKISYNDEDQSIEASSSQQTSPQENESLPSQQKSSKEKRKKDFKACAFKSGCVLC